MKRISALDTIAIFSPILNIGGAERAVVNLANGFIQKGKKVHLLLVRTEGKLLSEVHSDVKIFNFNKSRSILSLLALCQYLRAECPSILLSAQSHTNLIALWAIKLVRVSTRLVITEHTTMSVNFALEPGLINKIIPLLARMFYWFSDAIVCVSQGVAADLRKTTKISKEIIHIIYNPVVTDDLFRKAQEPLTHPWFISGEPPVVLSVGRLTTAKDYPTLIHAFNLVKQECKMRLLILGEGEKRLELERLVKSLGLNNYVQILGFTINPYAYMARASVFVLSSIWEGFGIVLVEALACGIPIVSTDCPSGPSEILQNGQFGRLVPVGDSEAMAKAILETLNDHTDRARLRQRSLDFTLEAAVMQYLALFNRLLNPNDKL